MFTIETLSTFLGWCLVIHIIALICIVAFLYFTGDFIHKINAKIFNLPVEESRLTVFRLVQLYRILVAIFFVVPWVALLIMSGS